MKRLYFASIGLTATMVLAAVSVATATYSHGANPTGNAVSVCAKNNPGQPVPKPAPIKQADAKANLSNVRLTAQAPIATVCYTFAGPTCLMRVAVPPRSRCRCYYPNGWLNGIAY